MVTLAINFTHGHIPNRTYIMSTQTCTLRSWAQEYASVVPDTQLSLELETNAARTHLKSKKEKQKLKKFKN